MLMHFYKNKSINGRKYVLYNACPLHPFFSLSFLYVSFFISPVPNCVVKVLNRKTLKLWYYIYITSGPFHSQFNCHCQDADTWSGRNGFDVMESKQRTLLLAFPNRKVTGKLQGPTAASHRPSFSSTVLHSTRASLSCLGVAITSACIRRVPVDSDGVSEMVEGVGTVLTWGLSSSIQAYVTPFCHTATASGMHGFLRISPS